MTSFYKISRFLNSNWGDKFYRQETGKRRSVITFAFSFSMPLPNHPTLLIVVKPAMGYSKFHKGYFWHKNKPIKVFLYDKETDLVFGEIIEVPFEGDWQSELFFAITFAEDRLASCKCPACGFWLMQRVNKNKQKFVGCSGYPDCTFTGKIKEVFNVKKVNTWNEY